MFRRGIEAGACLKGGWGGARNKTRTQEVKLNLRNYDHTQRKAAVKKEEKEKIVMRPSRNPQNDC